MCEITVIVPVYNAEKYIEECLESIVKQTYKNFELICVNDASTDNSLCILEKYCEKYENVHLVNNEVNRGQSYSRDAGVAVAKGRYILFIDADDYLDLNALEILANSVIDNDIDIVSFSSRTVYEGNYKSDGCSVIRKKEYPEVMEGIEAYLKLRKNGDYSWTIWQHMYRREFLKANNVKYIGGTNHEDMFYTFQTYMYAEKVRIISNIIHTYRVRGDSLMTGEGLVKLVNGMFVCYLAGLRYAMRLQEYTVKHAEAIEDYLSHLKRYICNRFSLCTVAQRHKCVQLLEDCIERYLFITLTNFDEKQKLYNENKLEDIRKYKNVYVYGAGSYGKQIIKLLAEYEIGINGLLVTKLDEKSKPIYGHKLIEYKTVTEDLKDALVIVAASEKYENEIIANLQNNKSITIVKMDEIYEKN